MRVVGASSHSYFSRWGREREGRLARFSAPVADDTLVGGVLSVGMCKIIFFRHRDVPGDVVEVIVSLCQVLHNDN